jgi:ELWxxDGT repeat protein
MLTDITTGFGGTWPAWLTVFNGELYFSAYDDTNGTELWKSDGSYAGTAMVMDINPVGESGPSDLVVFNNDLYFSADDSVHGSELWKVDHLTGTPVLAQDINTTADSNPGHLTVFNNDLYFTANDGTHGIELWKFDHTTLTASMVRDLNPGTGDGCYGNMVVFNNDLYFSGDDGTHGQELWKLDHLTGYTFMAKDVGGGTGNGLLVAVNDHLYFSASNDPLGLWAIGPGGSNPDNAAYVKIVDLPANGTLKYMSNPVSAGDSIPWAAAATGMLTFVPNADWNGATSFHFQVIDDGAPANGPDITSLQSTMTINVTPVNDSPVIETPWAQVIKDISPSGTADVTGVELGGYVYFRAYDASHGWELWRTDGTPYGTTLVSDINPAGDSWVYNFAVHNGIIYFSADDGTHGYELWRSDGTPAGTWMVKDINSSGSDSSAPSNLTSAGGILFFSADDGSGDELWKSDGTSAGTVMVKDINGASGSGIGWMTTFGTGVLFSADDGSGSELWKSDGTSAGTVMVNPAGADTDPTHITVMGGWAYYMASSPSEGYELWRSNGITTELVKDVNTSGDGLDTTPNQSFVAIGGILYFLANDGSGAGTELWRSDGSAPGTVMVEDILPTAGMSSGVHDLFNFNGCLYFSANDGVHGFELWKSDSTAAGTYLFADIIAGADSSGPHNFHATGSELFFLADPVAGFTTVYRTNGTSAPEAAGLIIPGGSIPDIVATSNNYALVKSPGEGTGFDNVLWRLDAGMHDTYVNKDTDLRFGYGSYDRIRISDPDATGDMQVQLTASNGTITLQDITGLNFSFSDGAGTGMGDGDHDALLCFRGSLTDVQTALDHMIFTPTTGFTGTTSINVQANDLDGAPISNGMFNIQVYPDNFAPVLDNTGTMNLTSITAEQTTNGGNTVASIIASAGGDRITDLNSDPEGIAITATTQTYGTWEYSIDGGTSWTAVGAVDSMNALLLRAADYVRFAADGTHSETATISFHAWDRTSWSGGDKVNASVTGGETPFSVGIEDATMHVAPITGLTIEKYAADGETNDDFGFSVAVSGDWAIVGVECDDNVNGTDAGAAYIYHWNGSAWAEQQMLIASDGAAGDCFGVSVAISGNYAIVGASSGDGAVADSGAAYIYHWNGATWGEEQKVTTPGGAYEDFYGATVAISGDYAIVGANAADGAAADSGAAFIYHRTGSTWGEEQMVTASDGATNDYFGCSVAISGDYAIVGAYAADGAEADSGAAYVYHWNGVTWGEEQKITASDATLGDVLGQTVAISGSYAVVGAPCADVTVSDTGAAYIYHWNGISWDQQKKITAPDGEDGLGFGDSVAISGDSLIVGAYHDTVGANTDQGSAYVFSRTMGGTDNWGLVEKVTASDGAANDFFGTGVGISGTTYLVGAAYGDGVVADTGSIYFSGTFTNSAPVLDPSGTMNLTWITSEQTTNSGNTVAEIIASAGGDRITDADIGALEGIAITATAQTYGFWEYSTNGGSIWNPVGFVDDAQALLLRATDYVRFSPDGIHAGDGTISFYAWDQTSGAFGTKVDTGVTGGSSAFSVASETAAIDVVPITELGHKIFAADGNTGDYYGYSVSMFGDWAAVGSQGDNGFTGSAHIYYRDQGGSNNWGWVKDVTASDGAASDYFGISVAGGGDWLVVGACQDDVGANTDQGSVYIFNRNEGGANNWGEVTADHLFAPAGAAWDNFGNSVAISGDYIVVGAYCDNSQQGSAYIYHWDMSNWVYVKQITASDGASTDQFGISVSISGDDVIVGSWMDDVGANTDQGSAYIFHFYVNTSVFRLSGGGTFCDK